MMPSVLYLIDAMLAPGGTETHLFDLATRLEGHGFHPIVCNLGGDEPELRRLAKAGIETWPRALKRLYAPSGRAEARRIVEQAAGRDVHIVQTFHFKADWLGVGVSRALGCPLISSRRDLGFSQTALRRFAYRFINPAVSRFIAPSRAVRDVVARREGVAPDRVEVIPNGRDLRLFDQSQNSAEARAWLGLPPEVPVIGMVGNLLPVKDHPTLLQAFSRILPSFEHAHLLLVGQGPEEERLKAMARELNIGHRVVFAGKRTDIPRVLAAMDVFVLSSHTEGMSNAIIEAMAAGLPVVASDVGGNAESVADGETGFIVPPRSPARMADRLSDLLRDRGLLLSMGSAGRQRAERLYDVDGMVRRTADLYRALRAQGRFARASL